MWLLNTKTLQLEAFSDADDPPPYAILSHTWGKEEVTFDEIHTPAARQKLGFRKIQGACAQARLDGFEYIWIDSCSIDKRSSAELSEAINSMFRWYSEAHVCYVFLADVDEQRKQGKVLRFSRWFKRGWTLQELLASPNVVFYSENWVEIGTKLTLIDEISDVTRIPHRALLEPDCISTYSVAQRMYWAALRDTERIEDMAYSLMGLFDVNMPLLYGEGIKAFRRLQLEILRQSKDHSIFAWALLPAHANAMPRAYRGVLAETPFEFCRAGSVSPVQVWTDLDSTISVTNLGLSLRLPIVSMEDKWVAFLSCQDGDQRIGIQVENIPGAVAHSPHYSRVAGSPLVRLNADKVRKMKANDVYLAIADYGPRIWEPRVFVSFVVRDFDTLGAETGTTVATKIHFMDDHEIAGEEPRRTPEGNQAFELAKLTPSRLDLSQWSALSFEHRDQAGHQIVFFLIIGLHQDHHSRVWSDLVEGDKDSVVSRWALRRRELQNKERNWWHLCRDRVSYQIPGSTSKLQLTIKVEPWKDFQTNLETRFRVTVTKVDKEDAISNAIGVRTK